MVIIDSYSKWPELYLTKTANAEFTKKALQKFFAREGVPQCIITDNGRHFTANSLVTWIKSIGSMIIFTPPRHPQSNEQAENFVRSLKVAIDTISPTNFDDLDQAIDNFLFQYRNAIHCTTKNTTAKLFHGRNMRTSFSSQSAEGVFS